MSFTPEGVISDLVNYIGLYNITLSKDAKRTLQDIEEFSLRCNYPCRYLLFFSKVIRNTKEIQKLFYNKGLNPNLVALTLEIKFYDSIDGQTNYQKGTKLYSYIHDRNAHEKTAILDKALQYCVKEERNVLENRDILLAAMDFYEKLMMKKTGNWGEPQLNTEYFTLSHVYGKYDENLWIRFDDIREYLMGDNYGKVKLRWV